MSDTSGVSYSVKVYGRSAEINLSLRKAPNDTGLSIEQEKDFMVVQGDGTGGPIGTNINKQI